MVSSSASVGTQPAAIAMVDASQSSHDTWLLHGYCCGCCIMCPGFPRTAVQARALEAAGIVPDAFLQLNVPDEVLIRRVTSRRLDPVTGKIYSTDSNPPPTGEVAARCVQRSDDTEEKIATRLRAFHQAIDAIAHQYAKVKIEFDGNQDKNKLGQQIKDTIAKIAAKHRHGSHQ
jgi:adenylate kinase family enzyme